MALKTEHQIILGDARRLKQIPDESVQLVLTSPPYPMIEMWDAVFSQMNPRIGQALNQADGAQAFALMHKELDKVWRHLWRVLAPGGFACINIGDAVRTLGENFQIYSNHAQVLARMSALGFSPLPDILWRKPTNSPNKFMGSGMLPAGAYVTYEHEYILVFRKGAKRVFGETEKQRRRESAYFWEERNVWFSDVWTGMRGSFQEMKDKAGRSRSAAFPFELAYRLICMYSLYGDTVLDPFVGTGTTTLGAMAAARNSLGVENDATLEPVIRDSVHECVTLGSQRLQARLTSHEEFVKARLKEGKEFRHQNAEYGFHIVTAQEARLRLYAPKKLVETSPLRFEVEYAPLKKAAPARKRARRTAL